MSWTPARLATEIAMIDGATGGVAVGGDLRGGTRVTSLGNRSESVTRR